MFLTYDIETASNPRAKHYYESLKASGYYAGRKGTKDLEKIKSQIEEKMQAHMGKAPLQWWTGRVVAIGCQLGSSTAKPKIFIDLDNEEKVLTEFFAYIKECSDLYPDLTLIGKENSDFDDPYLRGRAMANQIGIPNQLRLPGRLTDVNKIFGFSGKSAQRGKLSDYAYGLQLPVKLGDGSDVAKWVANKEVEKLSEYCLRDVQITAEILKRYNKQFK